jgi:DNA-binding SARP family transcriptional activator/DNA-binding XRE family transcriptional regulator
VARLEPDSVAGLLRAYRLRAGLVQQELASRAGLSVRALRNIERHHTGQPRAESVRRLAGALGLSLAERDQLLAQLDDARGLARLRVEILGPMAVWHGMCVVEPGSTMCRRLLGALALRPRTVVSRDELVDLLWGERPPRSAGNLLHGYVAQVRKLLEPRRAPRVASTLVVRARDGYRLDVDDEQIDLTRFDRLVDQARTLSNSDALGRYEEALSLWRGPVLADGGERLRQHPVAVAAAARRLAAVSAAADLALAMGRSEKALAWLRVVLPDEPLHEGLHARLVLALAGSGEPAAALRHYATVCDLLVEELGVRPGTELQAAHLAVLRQPSDVPASVAAGHAGADVPAQLPPAVPNFTGRREQLAQLDGLLPDEPAATGTTLVVTAIAGAGGIGKSALAIHWAHRVRNRFSDGQLFVNLHGFGRGLPLRPIDALSGLLRGLGVPGERIPAQQDEAAALYRSVVAGQRMLVMLDNAATAEQVRPLLPGTPTCLVVVTSRDRLGGLVASHGARPVNVDVLTPAEALELLRRMVGHSRLDAEPEATAQLARVCGYLPLALRIAAAQLVDSPTQTVAGYLAALASAGALDMLASDDDPSVAVRTTLDTSYNHLNDQQRRMFRLLALAPGRDLTIEAASALTATTPHQASRLMSRLVATHLIGEPTPGRYAFHDLVRQYATERTLIEDNAALIGKTATSASPTIGPGVPVLRVMSMEIALPFYIDYLGFTLDWEHQFEPGMPLYAQVSRSTVILHLSEHHGDGSPNGVVWFPVRDVFSLHQELLARPNAPLRPGINPDAPGGPTLQITDPYGNVLRFAQRPATQ